MTSSTVINKKREEINYLSSLFCIAICILMLVFGGELKAGASRGINLALTVIVPTLFPFFILSDLWAATFKIKSDGLIGRGFSALFGISGNGLSALLSGLVCGFPIGIKTATRLYEEKAISKDQLTRLCGFSNNPSAAFIISGVGLGLFGSLKIGIGLYFLTVISAVSCGIIFRGKGSQLTNSSDNSRQSFDLVHSVKNAGLSSITVSSYIIFFSALISFLSGMTNNRAIEAIIASFLEISCAVSLISNCAEFNESIRLVLTAFALGFSGLSVHLQAFCFMPPEASRPKYLLIKLTQGTISSVLMLLYILLK